MNRAHDRDFDGPAAPREIAAEASSEFLHPPSYEEMWGRPGQRPLRAARDLPVARKDRWPVVATLIAIVMGASALIAMRERIVRIVPLTASAYRAMGLPVNLAGLELRDVRSRIVMDGARKVLVTEGEIVNIRREQNRVPAITLAVRGANGLDRYSWTAPTPKSRLEPGEKIAFRARLASPPEDGADVLVRFAKAEDAKAPPTAVEGARKK
jgi:hypothetical protein